MKSYAGLIAACLIGANSIAAASIDSIVTRLKSGSEEDRKAAVEELDAFSHQDQISVDDGLAALKAAAELPEAAKDDAALLIRAAEIQPRPEYVQAVVAALPQYPDEAKLAALDLLARIDDGEALQAYLSLVGKNAEQEWFRWLPVGTLSDRPATAKEVLPRLFKLAPKARFASDIYLLALTYVQSDAVKSEALVPYSDSIISSVQAWREKATQLYDATKPASIWADDYQQVREPLGIALDLLGWIPTEPAKAELRESLKSPDPRLKLFATLSLIRQGIDVPADEIETVAKSDETRLWLFKGLRLMDKLDLMPADDKTQVALARSVMVDWLVYPTELHQTPDAIELIKQVTIETPDDGPVDYFVYRFRTDSGSLKPMGWMMGVCGGFIRSQQPTIDNTGETFSTFEQLGDTPPEAAVEKIRKLISDHWKERAATLKKD